MKIYLVICNGKVSGEAYTTLSKAQKFCESRGAKEDALGWVYSDGENVYMITDVQVNTDCP